MREREEAHPPSLCPHMGMGRGSPPLCAPPSRQRRHVRGGWRAQLPEAARPPSSLACAQRQHANEAPPCAPPPFVRRGNTRTGGCVEGKGRVPPCAPSEQANRGRAQTWSAPQGSGVMATRTGGADTEAVPPFPRVCAKGASEGARAQTLSAPRFVCKGDTRTRKRRPPPPCMRQGGKRGGARPNPKCPLGSHARVTRVCGSGAPLPRVCTMGASEPGGVPKLGGWPHPPLCAQGRHAYRVRVPPLCAKQRGTASPHTMGVHDGRGAEMGGTWGPRGMGCAAPFLLTHVCPLTLSKNEKSE